MKQEFIIAIDGDGDNAGLFKEESKSMRDIRPSDATRFPTPYHAQERVEKILKEMPDVRLAMVLPVFSR